MLHLDLWFHGQNVLIDPGTYTYNPQPPWAAHFSGTSAHNTVTVDDADQMRRGGRFLWHGWTRSRIATFSERADGACFSGEHYGYAPVTHRRSVYLTRATYLVIDELWGDGHEHPFRLHWLVNDFALEPAGDGARIVLGDPPAEALRLAVWAPGGARGDWQRANEAIPRGWQSIYYGQRRPAWSFAVTTRGSRVRFATLIGPEREIAPLLPLTGERAAELAALWGAAG
jgi:hypothetical protein